VAATVPGSVKKHCARLTREAEAAWQQLDVPVGINGKHTPPIALKVQLEKWEGASRVRLPDERAYPCLRDAWEAVLERARMPVALLVGEGGAGKTVALKWLAMEYALPWKKRRVSKEVPLPILVDFHSWLERDQSLTQFLHEHLPEGVPQGQRVFWMLDGLDLLPSGGPKGASATLKSMLDRAAGGPRASSYDEAFVVSTRPDAAECLPRQPELWHLQLLPLDGTQRRAWLSRWAPRETQRHFAGFESVNRDLAGLLELPLFFMLTLIACHKPPSRPAHPTPGGRADLLKELIIAALESAVRDGRIADRDKQIFESELCHLVCGVCWALMKERCEGKDASLDMIPREQADALLTKAHRAGQLGQLRRAAEVLRAARLMRLDAHGSSWRIVHQTVAEYWAACHLRRRLDDAFEGGWLKTELWDHWQYRQWDAVVELALECLGGHGAGPACMEVALGSLCGPESVEWGVVTDPCRTLTFLQSRIQAHDAREIGFRQSGRRAHNVRENPLGVLPLFLSSLHWDVVGTRARAPNRAGLRGKVRAIVPYLASESHRVRQLAVRLLCEAPREEVIPEMLSLLSSDTGWVRRTASRVVGSHRCVEAIPALMSMAKGSKEDCIAALVALTTTWGLRQEAQFFVAWCPRELYRSICHLGQEGMPSTVNHVVCQALRLLFERLAADDPAASRDAAHSLCRIRWSRLRIYLASQLDCLLKQSLRNSKSRVRAAIAELLGDPTDLACHGKRLKYLHLLREDPDTCVRRVAVDGILNLTGEDDKSSVGRILDGADDEVTIRVIDSLRCLSSSWASDFLVNLAEDDRAADQVRVAAVRVMGEKNSPKVEKCLTDLWNSNGHLAVPAMLSLGRQQSRAVLGPLMRLARKSVATLRAEITSVVSGIDDEKTDEFLASLLRDAADSVRHAALRGLMSRTSSGARDAVRAALRSDAATRREVIRVLWPGCSSTITEKLVVLADSEGGAQLVERSAEGTYHRGVVLLRRSDILDVLPQLLSLLADEETRFAARWMVGYILEDGLLTPKRVIDAAAAQNVDVDWLNMALRPVNRRVPSWYAEDSAATTAARERLVRSRYEAGKLTMEEARAKLEVNTSPLAVAEDSDVAGLVASAATVTDAEGDDSHDVHEEDGSSPVVELDFASKSVRVRGKPCTLTATQWDLLDAVPESRVLTWPRAKALVPRWRGRSRSEVLALMRRTVNRIGGVLRVDILPSVGGERRMDSELVESSKDKARDMCESLKGTATSDEIAETAMEALKEHPTSTDAAQHLLHVVEDAPSLLDRESIRYTVFRLQRRLSHRADSLRKGLDSLQGTAEGCEELETLRWDEERELEREGEKARNVLNRIRDTGITDDEFPPWKEIRYLARAAENGNERAARELEGMEHIRQVIYLGRECAKVDPLWCRNAIQVQRKALDVFRGPVRKMLADSAFGSLDEQKDSAIGLLGDELVAVMGKRQ